jgi:TnpA family transposase
MPKSHSNLLTLREEQFFYQMPIWSPAQRTEAFTFLPEELKQLKKYDASSGIYFAMTLATFKQQHTLCDFNIENEEKVKNIKKNIEHLRQRYYKNYPSTIVLPTAQKTKTRIENNVLELCGYQRCRDAVLIKLKKDLQTIAPRYPKQRGLSKALIDACTYHKIALPTLSTMSSIVREVWQNERQRVKSAYKRHSKRDQRQPLIELLDQGDQLNLTTLLQQEMKGYNTTEIDKTLEQHARLFSAFMTAKAVLPKLKLPANTIQYYASLINYYKGNQLAALDAEWVQLYLLCYSFLRFQQINDQLLEAFKKRTITYYSNAKREASNQAALQLASLQQVRQNVSNLLLEIKDSTHKTHIPKADLFRHVPELDLETTAQLLLSESLDPELLFWKEADKQSLSIQLNLRALFLTLDISILRHEALKVAVEFLKTTLSSRPTDNLAHLPKIVINWLPRQVCGYLLNDGQCHLKRFEFWLYYQLAQQVKSNKLTLQYTTKYKPIQDDLLSESTWQKSKPKILKTLPYTHIKTTSKNLIAEIKKENQQLFQIVNNSITNGQNPNVIVTRADKGGSKWRLKPLEEENPPNDSIFEKLPKRSIVDVMQFVDKQIYFTEVFDSITPRGAKHARSPDYILAGILANALRLGTDAMGSLSDLNIHSLLSVEKGCLRMETLTAALKVIHDHTIELPIFNAWNIDGVGHGSLDGMKIPSQLAHNKAQPSPKYFNMGVGLSSYSLILNHFPLAGKLIGANEYEGHFAFELSQFQNAATHLLQLISTDKHGVNSINFLLFYLVDKLFAPRIPKPHNETLWGFRLSGESNQCLLKPSKFFNEELGNLEWDRVQHVAASILTGDANASVIINKLASSRYTGKTKRAFIQLNNILKTNFILRYIHDLQFQHTIERSLNRGENFNRLYRAIALLNKGQLRGRSEVEMMIWDACTRLLAAIIQYYNTLILNNFYEKATDRQVREFLLRASPTAWAHINLLGHYQFYGNQVQTIWRWIKGLRFQDCVNFG